MSKAVPNKIPEIKTEYYDKKSKCIRFYFEDALDADFKRYGIATKEQLDKIYRKEFKKPEENI